MAAIPIKTGAGVSTETVETRFHRLAAAWHKDTCYLSSMDDAEAHPAYQEVIQMGPEVVPHLLRDLAANHTHWFGALQAITGARPILAADAGNVSRMADAWLHWAKDNGYQW